MPTRLEAETALIAASSGFAAVLGLTAGMSSPVAALSGPIAEGLAACGVTPANPVNPTDADMARLPGRLWPKFVAVAGLTLLEQAAETMLSRPVSQESPTYKVTYDRAGLLSLLENKRKAVAALYGYGIFAASSGRVFQPGRIRSPEF